MPMGNSGASLSRSESLRRQHCLYFFPLPHGHGALRETFLRDIASSFEVARAIDNTGTVSCARMGCVTTGNDLLDGRWRALVPLGDSPISSSYGPQYQCSI